MTTVQINIESIFSVLWGVFLITQIAILAYAKIDEIKKRQQLQQQQQNFQQFRSPTV